MTEYERLLDRMHFEIGSTLMDNDMARKGVGGIIPQDEPSILRSSRRTYMNLKVMMMRLERELFGEKKHEEDETEVSRWDADTSNNTESKQLSSRGPRVGDFSC